MYIFGYGSLINAASRQLSGQTGQAIPAIAHGLVRQWGKIDDSYSISPLVVTHGNSQVNGVLLEIDAQALQDFDRRERGYQRVQLDASQIETGADFDTSRTVWIYLNHHTLTPSTSSPIAQSYVDTVLAGCLNISEEFARHFVRYTQGWQYPWENDRTNPKYARVAGVSHDHYALIDQLLAPVNRIEI